jgi:hypothetical protein
MNRRQLEHLLVVASRIAKRDDVVVIGSQAILGSYAETELPTDVTMSREADLAFWDDESQELSDRVDGAIGEMSEFDAMHGYYAQGVSLSTAVLPHGWRDRLVRYDVHGGGVTGWCLEPHDLALSKLAAHREKDKLFVGALIESGIIDVAILDARVHTLDASPVDIAAVRREYEAWAS